jgi:hypothetical protein
VYNFRYRKEHIHKEKSNLAELDVIEIMSRFDNVEKVWKDLYNSKFDIYYTLKNENFIRGLQVKWISPIAKRKNGFSISDLDKYPDGLFK